MKKIPKVLTHDPSLISKFNPSTLKTTVQSQQREFMKALNTTKIERLLSKPFIAAHSTHTAGINQLELSNSFILSCDFTNNLIKTSLSDKTVQKIKFSENIRDLTIKNDNETFFATNKNIYKAKFLTKKETNKKFLIERETKFDDVFQEKIFSTENLINSVFYENYTKNVFCATNKNVQLIDIEKPQLTQEFSDLTGITNIKAEKYAVCLKESEFFLIDPRTKTHFYKKNLAQANTECAISNNKFVISNNDHNSYLFDLRRLDNPFILRGHVRGVTSCCFNESSIFTGSFDKTLRIYDLKTFKQSDVFYNKRMGEVTKVRANNQIVFSGSVDGNIREWKSSNEIEAINRKNKNARKIAVKIKQKFEGVKEIQRIDKHRFLPKKLKGELKNKYEHYKAVERRKNKNHKK